MSATQPPNSYAAGERTERRAVEALATAGDGSWRTLIQKWENGEWVTHSEYPGDWAWQWQHVATEERARVTRLRAAIQDAAAKLQNLY